MTFQTMTAFDQVVGTCYEQFYRLLFIAFTFFYTCVTVKRASKFDIFADMLRKREVEITFVQSENRTVKYMSHNDVRLI